MKIEYKKPSEIIPYKNNPRKNEDAIDKVATSISEYGFKQPIVIDKNNIIIVGHTRWKAALKMNLEKVPVLIAEDLTPAQVKAYRIADNKTGEFSAWDFDELNIELEELKELDVNLDWLEFDDNNLSAQNNNWLTDDDAIPEEVEPICKTGELWKLGNHRILCGDATKKDDVERLMDGKKADMVFTDPPYNVDYGASKNPRHKIRTIENDKQTPEEWELFCKEIYSSFKSYCNGDIYMWGASGPDGMKMRLLLVEYGCHWSATIVWKKQQLVLSPAKYQRMYEPCFYGWFNKSSFGEDRKQTEVWEIDRPHNSKLHPTMKPVELCEIGINNSSKVGNVVLDLFLGSGSTLIACEKTGRKCYGMEIDPHYCDVIIKRWEDFTGMKAELIDA